MKAIIFDLDQTLVDSQFLESVRAQRNWNEVMRRLPEVAEFDGISDLLADLKSAGFKIAIVTKSPSMYCTGLIRRFGWPIDFTVCYHDCNNQKPHPEPILKALTGLGCDPSEVIGVGDHKNDITAYLSAEVTPIFALWGIPLNGISDSNVLMIDSIQGLREYILNS